MDHDFSADRPISSSEEDVLDRAPFAESLAKAISSWQGKDSLVVALHGDWGSGKSSLKNMVLDSYPKLSITKPLVIEFNPWEWAGQERISKSFFEQVSASIGQQNKGKKWKIVATKIRLYGLYLNTGATLVAGLSAALPVLFSLAALLGLTATLSNAEWLKNLSGFGIGVLILWAAFLKWGGGMAANLFGIAEEYAKSSAQTLEELKGELTRSLKDVEQPLLIILDDIDRLTPEETRIVFQLVKANADFPNVIYLLLFQRDIVEQRLSIDEHGGRAYLEKIIQVPFDIPSIEQERLERVLFAALDRTLETDKAITKHFDQSRWGNLFYGGLRPYFSNLRNVYRFSSTFSFHVSLLQGERAFEVNPVDLIGIECLRVFEPDVYKAISTSKSLMTSSHSDGWEEQQAKSSIDNIISKSSEEHREHVKEIIEQLFPPIESLMGGCSYGADFQDAWFKELRVCHAEVFSRYFQLAIPVDDISQSELENLIELSSDRDGLVNALNALKERGLLKSALSQLDAYKQDVLIEHSGTFVPALMDIGDTVEDKSIGFLGIGAHTHLVRIVLWYLRQEESVETRGKLLLTAFSKSTGLSIMASILSGEINRRKDTGKEALLLTDDDTLETAKSALVEKIASAAKNDPGTFLQHEYLAQLLYIWREWGEAEKAPYWVKENVVSPDHLLVFLDSFTSQVTSQGFGDYTAQIKYRINLGSVEAYIPLETIHTLHSMISKEELNERQQQIFDALNNAIDRREKGNADDAWDD